jgi:hypothetical protein
MRPRNAANSAECLPKSESKVTIRTPTDSYICANLERKTSKERFGRKNIYAAAYPAAVFLRSKQSAVSAGKSAFP